MARGQDAPVRTGGQIDPYVVSSMQQNKQATENRLVTAMQEQGATQRTAISSGAQLAGQKMQVEAGMAQSAAQIAAEDRRAAEAERGRREDQKYELKMEEIRQGFEVKENKLNRDHAALLQKGLLDDAKVTRESLEATRRVQLRIAAIQQRNQDNLMGSLIRGSQMREMAGERLITDSEIAIEQTERETTLYTKLIKATEDQLNQSDLVMFPFQPKMRYKPAMGPFGEAAPGEYGEVPGQKLAKPMEALQSQLTMNKTGISVEDLDANNIYKVEQQLAEKKITFAEIRDASATIEATLAVVGKLKEKATGQEKLQCSDAYEKIAGMRDSLEGLRYSRKPIRDSKFNVGAEVKTALGVKYSKMSYGRRMAEIRQQTGADNKAYLNEITKSIEPVQLLEIDPKTMLPAEIKETELYNNAMRQAYPDILNKSISGSAWGGAE